MTVTNISIHRLSDFSLDVTQLPWVICHLIMAKVLVRERRKSIVSESKFVSINSQGDCVKDQSIPAVK